LTDYADWAAGSKTNDGRRVGKQASNFIRQNNMMTILIQDVNNTMAGYRKEILPSSWSPNQDGHLGGARRNAATLQNNDWME